VGLQGAVGPTGAGGPSLGVIDCAQYWLNIGGLPTGDQVIDGNTAIRIGRCRFDIEQLAPTTGRIVPLTSQPPSIYDYTQFRLLLGTYRISWSVPVLNASTMVLKVSGGEVLASGQYLCSKTRTANALAAHTNTVILRVTSVFDDISICNGGNVGGNSIILNSNANAQLNIECIRAT
jgi:hypothetical protein